MWLLSAKITIDLVVKFAKLSSAKLVSLLICQTLIPPNFRRLRYVSLISIAYQSLSCHEIQSRIQQRTEE